MELLHKFSLKIKDKSLQKQFVDTHLQSMHKTMIVITIICFIRQIYTSIIFFYVIKNRSVFPQYYYISGAVVGG